MNSGRTRAALAALTIVVGQFGFVANAGATKYKISKDGTPKTFPWKGGGTFQALSWECSPGPNSNVWVMARVTPPPSQPLDQTHLRPLEKWTAPEGTNWGTATLMNTKCDLNVEVLP